MAVSVAVCCKVLGIGFWEAYASGVFDDKTFDGGIFESLSGGFKLLFGEGKNDFEQEADGGGAKALVKSLRAHRFGFAEFKLRGDLVAGSFA